MTQCVQLDLFAGDGSSTGVFRICPKEAYNADLRDFIELCGGIVLEPGDEDPCVINIVDIDWMMKNHRALLKTARFPDDHFLPNFIYDCYETKEVQNLNKYRLGGSAYETYDANEILLRVKSWNDLERKEVDDDEEETNNAWDDVRNNHLECASNSSEKENVGYHDGEAHQSNGIRVEMTSNQELLLRNHLDGTADELTVTTGAETVEEELILPEEMLTGWSARANRTNEQTEEIASNKANKNMLNLFGVPDFQDELTSVDNQNENVRSKRKRGRVLKSKKAVESDTGNPKRLKKKAGRTGQGQRLTRKKLKSLRAAKDVIELSGSDSDKDSVIKPRSTSTRFLKKAVRDESDEQEETEVLPKRKKLLVDPSRIATRDSCNGDGDLNGTSLGVEESDDFDPRESPVHKENLLPSPAKSKTVSLREDSELVISPIHSTPRIRSNQIYSDSSSEDSAAQNKSRSTSSSSSNLRVKIAETANRRAPSNEMDVVEKSDESEIDASFQENRSNRGSKVLAVSPLKSSRGLRKPNILPAGKAKKGDANGSVRRNVRRVERPIPIPTPHIRSNPINSDSSSEDNAAQNKSRSTSSSSSNVRIKIAETANRRAQSNEMDVEEKSDESEIDQSFEENRSNKGSKVLAVSPLKSSLGLRKTKIPAGKAKKGDANGSARRNVRRLERPITIPTPHIRSNPINSDSSSEDNAAQNNSRSTSSSSSNLRVKIAETANRRAPSNEMDVVEKSDESEVDASFEENRSNKGSKVLAVSPLKSSRGLRKPNILPAGKAKKGDANGSARRNVRRVERPITIPTPHIRSNLINSDSSSEDNAAQNNSRSTSSSSSNLRVKIAETANRRAPSNEMDVVEKSDESEVDASFEENRSNKGSKVLAVSPLKSSRGLRKTKIPAGKAKNGAANDSVRRNVRQVQRSILISSSDSESHSDSEARIPNPKKASPPKLNLQSMEIDSDEDLEYSDSEACPYCSFKANDVKKVAQHVSEEHDNRHKCKDCEFSTTLAYKLRLHRAKIHQ